MYEVINGTLIINGAQLKIDAFKGMSLDRFRDYAQDAKIGFDTETVYKILMEENDKIVNENTSKNSPKVKK